MKVVFDTNILVSALVFPGGRADIALRRIFEERDHLLHSRPILDELLGILARKFSRDAEEQQPSLRHQAPSYLRKIIRRKNLNSCIVTLMLL
ncbi:MAG: PIN domain-containing protein [Burkholderiales bacterium]